MHYVHSLRYILWLRNRWTAILRFFLSIFGLRSHLANLVNIIRTFRAIYKLQSRLNAQVYNPTVVEGRDSNHALQRYYASYVEPMHFHIKNITYLHRQVMMVQMNIKCYCKRHTAVWFCVSSRIRTYTICRTRDSFPYIRSNGQIHRFPPFPLLGVGQLCLPVSPLRRMTVL